MKPYVPSGKTDEGAHLALILTVVLTALAVGGLANLVGQYIRLLILFPAAMGGLVGAAALQIALAKKMRTPALVITTATLGGLLCWFTDFGIDYLRSRSFVREQVELVAADLEEQGLGAPTEDDIERTVDVTLVYFGEQYAVDPLVMAVNLLNEPLNDGLGSSADPEPAPSSWQAFAGHVRNLAAQGTSISDVGRADDATNLGSTGTYLLWLFELLIVMGVAGAIGWEQARQPFCERCEQWFQRKERLVALAPISQRDAVLTALQGGGPHALAEAFEPFDNTQPFIALAIRSCDKCASAQLYLDVVALTAKKNKTHRKSLRKGLVESRRLEEQLRILGEAAQAAAAGSPG
jgi:hypothetical protein